MINGPDAQSSKFLNDLAAIAQRLDRAQRQISSGRRINDVSDDPDEISHLLGIRSDLSQVEQFQVNLGLIQTEVDTGEQALGQAIQAMDRIGVLGAQGASDLTPADSRNTIAVEIDELLGQVVNLANSQVDGRYLFSGDNDQAPPYTFDLSQPNPIGPYQGSASTRLVQHPSGQRISIAKTADEIFANPDPTLNVFDSVNALRAALRANDTAAIKTALGNVRTASVHLNNMQAFYGGVQNQVADAADFASKQVVRLKTQISQTEDADITSAILELNQSKFIQETALSAQSRQPRTSLFDYLR